MVESHYDRMRKFIENTEGEVQTKTQKIQEIQELIELDRQLMNIAPEAYKYIEALSTQIAKAEALLDTIEKYKPDPKLSKIVEQEIQRYKEFVNTFIEPIHSYVQGLYKAGILDKALKVGTIFDKAQALIDKKHEYERDP